MRTIIIISGLLILFINLRCEMEPRPQNTPPQIIETGKYALIEIQHHLSGLALSNHGIGLDILGINAYEFDPENGVLTLQCNDLKKRDTIKKSEMICLDKIILDKSVGSGIGKSFILPESFPYQILFKRLFGGEKDSIAIGNPGNEQIEIYYNNISTSIKSNTEKAIISQYFYTNGDIKYFMTDSIFINNHGRQERNKINFK
jgi:hypothetical protein